MPRPPATDPAPSLEAARAREKRRRNRNGLVLVQIGPEKFEVSKAGAKRLRKAAEALIWAEGQAPKNG